MGRRGRGRGRGGGGRDSAGGHGAPQGQQAAQGGAAGGAWGWGAGPPGAANGGSRPVPAPAPQAALPRVIPPSGAVSVHQQMPWPPPPSAGTVGESGAGVNGFVESNGPASAPATLAPQVERAPLPQQAQQAQQGGQGGRPGGRPFEDLTSIDPQPRLTLEHPGCSESCRLIDLFCPIGRGQRALIVSPPKAGKTTLLKDIAAGIARNHPELELIALLVDERPEEVTDFRRYFAQLGNNARVIASSNDNNVDKHTQISVETMNECKRAVVAGRHIVVVLDSITRLARAFNNHRRFASGGRTMTGGVDSKALEVPRQIFGSARNTEEAGSLTIIATCLVDTGSAMDQVIFEEFKGSGNMELILDRKIAEKRYFPAINLAASGTRKEHLLLDAQELKTMTALRRQLLTMPPHVQVERLLIALKRFATNADLVGSAAGGAG